MVIIRHVILHCQNLVLEVKVDRSYYCCCDFKNVISKFTGHGLEQKQV